MKQSRTESTTITEDICDKCSTIVVSLTTDENLDFLSPELKCQKGFVWRDIAYHLNCICELDGKDHIFA